MAPADGDPIFLDASVVMYAAGAEHPLREPCRRALRRIVDDNISLVTSSEVLQEILHRYFAIDRPDDAQTVFESTRDLCSEIFAVTESDTERALVLLLEHPRLSPRDAIHVAVAERNQIDHILSTDSDFDIVPGIHRLDPRRLD